ncbi:unnamed protein product [Eretmochelys imbricata]
MYGPCSICWAGHCGTSGSVQKVKVGRKVVPGRCLPLQYASFWNTWITEQTSVLFKASFSSHLYLYYPQRRSKKQSPSGNVLSERNQSGPGSSPDASRLELGRIHKMEEEVLIIFSPVVGALIQDVGDPGLDPDFGTGILT